MKSKNNIVLSQNESTDFPNLPFRIVFETFNFDNYDEKFSDIIFKNDSQSVIYNTSVIFARPNFESSQGNKILSINIMKRVENTNKYLVDLLNLRSDLSTDLFNEITNIERLLDDKLAVINAIASKPIPDKDINNIIKWCIKNGYPYSQSNKSLEYYSTGATEKIDNKIEYTIKNSLIKPNVEYKFSLWEFLIDLHILCLVFILINKTKNPDYYICRHLEKQYGSYLIKYNAEKRLDLITKIFSRARLIAVPNFCNIKNEKIFEVNKTTSFDPIIFYTDNAFDLALYIAYFSTMSEYNSIKLCPCCFKYFVPKRRNQKYCYEGRSEKKIGKCYPQLVYKRKQAEKKANHKNET